MKTMKPVLIATFVAFAMMSFSAVNLDQAKPDKKIAIEKAMMDRVILSAMNYISEDLIAVEHQGFYYARVRVRNTMITIYGDLEAWQEYFIQRKWVNNNNMPIKIDRYVY
jgi:hypothetical protein